MAVLISGRGSNMAALLDYAAQPATPVEAALVLADRDAPGLEIARQRGIDSLAIPRADHESQEDHEAAMAEAIDGAGAELVCLAGFMRLLSAGFCERYRGRLVNIHPSLLPRHKGLDTHEKAILAKDAVHGCSVHFVTPGMDEGPVVAQSVVHVRGGETTVEALADMVLKEEHRLYPLVVGAIAAGLVAQDGDKVVHRPGDVPGRIEGMEDPPQWKREMDGCIVVPVRNSIWKD